MRKIFSSVAVLVMLIFILGSCRRMNQRLGFGDSRYILISKQAFPASSIKQVIASTSGGNIEVIGDATDQATLEVLGSYKSNDSATIVAKVNEYMNLSITHNNSLLTVKAERKQSFNSVSPITAMFL